MTSSSSNVRNLRTATQDVFNLAWSSLGGRNLLLIWHIKAMIGSRFYLLVMVRRVFWRDLGDFAR